MGMSSSSGRVRATRGGPTPFGVRTTDHDRHPAVDPVDVRGQACIRKIEVRPFLSA
jgi:hypothetical protein